MITECYYVTVRDLKDNKLKSMSVSKDLFIKIREYIENEEINRSTSNSHCS